MNKWVGGWKMQKHRWTVDRKGILHGLQRTWLQLGQMKWQAWWQTLIFTHPSAISPFSLLIEFHVCFQVVRQLFDFRKDWLLPQNKLELVQSQPPHFSLLVIGPSKQTNLEPGRRQSSVASFPYKIWETPKDKTFRFTPSPEYWRVTKIVVKDSHSLSPGGDYSLVIKTEMNNEHTYK